ncbi:hypothetical protein WDU94_006564 [Cyamophila willieti]
MATTSAGNRQTPPNDEGSGDQKKTDGDADKGQMFDCNICLDTAKDAVISMCGHLFCVFQLAVLMRTCPSRQTCPVCKAAIDRDKVIPVYGRGGNSKTDPRDKVPPRPQGQRTEPDSNGVSFELMTYALFNVILNHSGDCILLRIEYSTSKYKNYNTFLSIG